MNKPFQAKHIIAASFGNALEWYDIVLYGYFSLTISQQFFNPDAAQSSLLFALATFAISYLARPVGAIFLGSYADKKGRKASMLLSIALMTIGTGMIVFTAVRPPISSSSRRSDAVSSPAGKPRVRALAPYSLR